MNSKQVRALAERLVAGPKPCDEKEIFVRDALAASEEILKESDEVG